MKTLTKTLQVVMAVGLLSLINHNLFAKDHLLYEKAQSKYDALDYKNKEKTNSYGAASPQDQLMVTDLNPKTSYEAAPMEEKQALTAVRLEITYEADPIEEGTIVPIVRPEVSYEAAPAVEERTIVTTARPEGSDIPNNLTSQPSFAISCDKVKENINLIFGCLDDFSSRCSSAIAPYCGSYTARECLAFCHY